MTEAVIHRTELANAEDLAAQVGLVIVEHHPHGEHHMRIVVGPPAAKKPAKKKK